MFRALSLMTMAGGFLMISPTLRDSLLGGYTQASVAMDEYSPYSYIALGLALIGALMIFMNKGAQPR